MKCVKILGSHNWSGAYSSLQPNVLPSSGFKARFWAFWVGNRLVLGVSVPRHFLNDTNIFYTSHVMRVNTWKTKLEWGLFFFQPKIPPCCGFRSRFWKFWSSKWTRSWSISTKALSEWYNCQIIIAVTLNRLAGWQWKSVFVWGYQKLCKIRLW